MAKYWLLTLLTLPLVAQTPAPLTDQQKLIVLRVENQLNKARAELFELATVLNQRQQELDRLVKAYSDLVRAMQEKSNAKNCTLTEVQEWNCANNNDDSRR